MAATAPCVELTGITCSGLGEGSRFTAIDWVQDEFRLKLGFVPCPGTFNLRMHGPEWARMRRILVAASGIDIEPAAGFCAAKCFPVRIAGRLSGALVLPDMHDYPQDKVEIIAPMPLREVLGVVNGDRVALRIDVGGSMPRPSGERLARPAIPPLEGTWLTSGERS
ncbi:DUF120 domain-containing protein [Aromatoleum diolicum]|uniref:Riboflavin kinase n=1 Tax=Aromatoleum diolicum TaxID=75796 RepID=A0ABX1Q9W9_9RHOO|nr:DUF120 domain-containing protein [Aromatoleum diolicum]NMG75159.1 DUF120 domain-containing protein [Aromatoleum diolicum]